MKLTLDVTATDGRARTGTVTTSRGTFRTPLYMPVGTRGSIRALMTHELAGLRGADGTQAEIVLGNTYHLMLRPGADVVAALGGLHRFTGWGGLMLTASGGYQVFSLEPKLHDGGAEFRSTYDGSTHLLTPEGAVATQELLGADIQMVLDVCAPLPSSREALREALELTSAWAARARPAHRRAEDQALFGIVQGGAEVDLRTESARRTAELDFDGFAVGGLSVGETRDEMLPALAAALDELPEDQPRYLMGVGDPVSIVESVAMGIDMFDCVLPTRLARHGTLLTDHGRLNIKRSEFARSDDPVDASCPCATCRRYSRGYLRHLSSVGEPAAAPPGAVHNQASLRPVLGRPPGGRPPGRLHQLRREVAEVWTGSGPGLGMA